MKNSFQLSQHEIRNLEIMLENSTVIESVEIKEMNNQNCSGCQATCTGSCADGCAGGGNDL